MAELSQIIQKELNERLLELEKRLVAGAYVINSTNCDESSLDKSLRQYKMLGVSYFKYYSQIKKEELYVSTDSFGEIRGDSSKKGELIDTKKLINEYHYEGIKNNKSKMLGTLIYSIFDDKGFGLEISPKETMNLMEKLFNVNFSGTKIDGKVNIKKSSFSSIFYLIKKKRLADYKSLKNFDHSYKELKDLTSLLLSEGYDESNFSNLQENDLANIMPSYKDLDEDDAKYFKVDSKLKSKELLALINDNKLFAYPYLLRKIYSKALNKEYENNLANTPKPKLLELAKKYSKKLNYDSFKRLEYMRSEINLMSFGKTISSALGLGLDGVIENAISGAMIDSLNKNEQLSVKKLKSMSVIDKEEYAQLYFSTMAETKESGIINPASPAAAPIVNNSGLKAKFIVPNASAVNAQKPLDANLSIPKVPNKSGGKISAPVINLSLMASKIPTPKLPNSGNQDNLSIPPVPEKKINTGAPVIPNLPPAPKLPGSQINLPSGIKAPVNLQPADNNNLNIPAVPKRKEKEIK